MKLPEYHDIKTDQSSILLTKTGEGPPVLLLHGFPQTHLMWRYIVPLLADNFTVICADLPGYGRSSCPPSASDHTPYSKRAMSNDLVYVMRQLGFQQFSVVGHDRGGRVAYRMALDHLKVIRSLALLDILPTAEVWGRADKQFALDFWPWSLLAQAAPLPEKILEKCFREVVDAALDGWGTPGEVFDPAIRAAYYESFRDPLRIHAICEEYRVAATVDHEHDLADLKEGRRIECPLLVLWSKYMEITHGRDKILSIWRRWGRDVKGEGISAGHFFAEERPMETVGIVQIFIKRAGLLG